MKAVVYKGPKNVQVEEVDDPKIEAPTDALLKVTSTAICGSDLHMYEGRSIAPPGTIFGHEIMGVIEETGSALFSIRKGDRAVLPFNIGCGVCFNCVRQFPNACLTANPEAPTAGYGYAGMGPYPGGQAEYVRVPFADYNCLKLPGTPYDDWEDDFVLLADIFPTGFHATQMAGVSAGTTVGVFGAGPVGLLSAYSALLQGAAEVYVVDFHPDRLDKAKQIGATPIDFTKGDPVEQIMNIRKNNRALVGSLRPGEEKMPGVMSGIDAVGYQALDRTDPSRESHPQVIDDLIRLVNSTGMIGLIGVYFPADPGAENPEAKKGEYLLPLGRLWEKGITVATGQAPVKRYNTFLRDQIIDGKAKPSFIVSHRLPLSDASEAYKAFDNREKGYTKIVLKPEKAAFEKRK